VETGSTSTASTTTQFRDSSIRSRPRFRRSRRRARFPVWRVHRAGRLRRGRIDREPRWAFAVAGCLASRCIS